MTLSELERRLDLRGIHSERMLIEFGAAGLSGDSLDFRDGQEKFLGLSAHVV